MKSRFLILFLLLEISLFAQNTKVYLEPVNIREKNFTGIINNKYPITIHLEFGDFSKEHSGIYSVKGWYYYDKVKTNIPLVGFYDGSLTLYVFNQDNQDKAELLLNQTYETEEGFGAEIDYYLNMKGFDEKFHIDLDDKGKAIGTWENAKNKFNVSLNTTELFVFENQEFLCLNNGGQIQKINLHQSDKFYGRDFELSGFKSTASGTKVLLRYSYTSNEFINGRCGAGIETGYILLNFNKQNELLTAETHQLESCYEDVYYEEVPSDKPDFLKFNIEKEDGHKTLYVNETEAVLIRN